MTFIYLLLAFQVVVITGFGYSLIKKIRNDNLERKDEECKFPLKSLLRKK